MRDGTSRISVHLTVATSARPYFTLLSTSATSILSNDLGDWHCAMGLLCVALDLDGDLENNTLQQEPDFQKSITKRFPVFIILPRPSA